MEQKEVSQEEVKEEKKPKAVLPEIDTSKPILDQIGDKHFNLIIRGLFSMRQTDGSFKNFFYFGYCFDLTVVPLKDVINYKEKIKRHRCKQCNERGYYTRLVDVTKNSLAWLTTVTNNQEWKVVDLDRDEFMRQHAGSEIYGQDESGNPDPSKHKGKMPVFIPIISSCICVEDVLKRENPNYYHNKGRTEWYKLDARKMTEEEVAQEEERQRKEALMAKAIFLASKDIPGLAPNAHLSLKMRNPLFNIRLREECEKLEIESGIPGKDTEEGKQLEACANAGLHAGNDFRFSGHIGDDLANEAFKTKYTEECTRLGIKPVWEKADDSEETA